MGDEQLQDQGGIAPQHRYQQRMHLGPHRVLGPEGQEPPQSRAASLLESGAQAAPRQAFTQEPAQGGNHTHDRAARMARSALRWWFAHNDEVRNQVQKSEIQHGHRQVVAYRMMKGTMGGAMVVNGHDYAAMATPVTSAQAVNA